MMPLFHARCDHNFIKTGEMQFMFGLNEREIYFACEFCGMVKTLEIKSRTKETNLVLKEKPE